MTQRMKPLKINEDYNLINALPEEIEGLGNR